MPSTSLRITRVLAPAQGLERPTGRTSLAQGRFRVGLPGSTAEALLPEPRAPRRRRPSPLCSRTVKVRAVHGPSRLGGSNDMAHDGPTTSTRATIGGPRVPNLWG